MAENEFTFLLMKQSIISKAYQNIFAYHVRVSDFRSPPAMWKVYYVNLKLAEPDHQPMVVSSPAVVPTESMVVIVLYIYIIVFQTCYNI